MQSFIHISAYTHIENHPPPPPPPSLCLYLSVCVARVDNYMGNWSLCGVLQGADSATFGRSVAVGAPPALKQPPAPTQQQVTDISQRTSNTEK